MSDNVFNVPPELPERRRDTSTRSNPQSWIQSPSTTDNQPALLNTMHEYTESPLPEGWESAYGKCLVN